MNDINTGFHVTNSTFRDFILSLVGVINSLLPVVAGLALLVFFIGLAKFIGKAGDSKNHEEGKNLMVWGIIALFVMVSFMGIIRLFHSDLGLKKNVGIPVLPQNYGPTGGNGEPTGSTEGNNQPAL